MIHRALRRCQSAADLEDAAYLQVLLCCSKGSGRAATNGYRLAGYSPACWPAGWIGLVLSSSLVIGRLGLRWSVLNPGLPLPLTGLARHWCSRDAHGCDQPFGLE